MIRSYKVRLEPNNKQHARMMQYAGAARYAYNWALEQQDKNHKAGGKFLSDCTLRKQFTVYKQTNTWLYGVSNEVTAQAITDACLAYTRFFKKQSNFPKFKSRKRSKPSFYQDGFKVKATDTHIKLEKISNSLRKNRQIANWVKLSEKNRIPIVET